MKRLISFIAVCSVALLCGCRTGARLPRTQNARVAVVATIPPSFAVHTLGFAPAFQSAADVTAPDLDVRAEAERIVSDALAHRGYTVVKTSPSLREAASRVSEPRGRNDFAEQLKSLRSECDLLVLVNRNDALNMNGEKTGLGGVELIPSRVLGSKRLMVCCNLSLSVCSTSEGRNLTYNVEQSPMVRVEGVSWNESWNAFTPAEQGTIKQLFRAQLKQTLDGKVESILE